jgi:hypothetical protein
MRCHRCQNMMFPVDMLDEAGGILSQATVAWRCFACGEIIDPLIRLNRSRGHHTEPYKRGPRLQRASRAGLHASAATKDRAAA